jgi:hypothetical protein
MEENKKARLRWCLKMLDPDILDNESKFIDMRCIIHTNEKWFNATKKNMTVYMLPDEEDPHRTVQNKNSIDKMMLYSEFLSLCLMMMATVFSMAK